MGISTVPNEERHWIMRGHNYQGYGSEYGSDHLRLHVVRSPSRPPWKRVR
jgi:hypothetical protein